jgi:hypothetical protein
MKHFFVALLSMLSLTAMAQSESKEIDGLGGGCLPHEYESWVFDPFNFRFRRPKLDCEKGFGMCCKPACFYTECRPRDIRDFYKSEEFQNEGKVVGYVKDRKLFLHFPKSFSELDEYRNDDLSIFFIDEDIDLGKRGIIKSGEYKTIQDEFGISVEIDIN